MFFKLLPSNDSAKKLNALSPIPIPPGVSGIN